MSRFLSSSLNNVVSIDLENSWAARDVQDLFNFSRFLTARFQQKQMQEKEEKLLRLYENQQQRAFERVGRGSAESNSSITSTGGGKVRALFEERRQKAGVDKSYPLEPINGKMNGKTNVNTVGRTISNARPPVITNSRKTVQATVQRSVTHIRNGKPLVNKRETIQKIYDNNNGVSKFEENHFKEDFLDGQNNLVDLMNKHNICDSLDDEQSPPLEAVDDDVYFIGKLSNVGGTPPSQNIVAVKAIPDKTEPAIREEIKRVTPVKSIAKKSPLKSQTSIQKSNTPSRTPSRGGSSASSSPQHTSLKMTTTTKPTPPTRTPNTAKPSSKQTAPRSAMSTVVRDDLLECSYCGRRFAADRVQKHEDVCSKTNKKQRKTYDAFKHRVQGTEIEQFCSGKKKGSKSSKKPMMVTSGQNKKNWRRTHEEFIATIRSAKMTQAHLASGGKLSDLPPPPPSSNPDYVQCPSCGRRFNEAAAQRHIPKCASFEFNKPKPGAAKKR
ncbi:hypothetical protein WA026_013485 [Henosepilachna vigintioctopunctata]|uniref:C2HC/C3H-type domain-containing protein n=1 Tax=Henosepilachna vigintioctopunctata TaxID=420089 RepID=A0AAW1VEY0_9CUCU